jgi:polyisoprenoid-binding protein YceI
MLRILLPVLALCVAPSALAQDWIIDHGTSSVGFQTSAFGGDVSGQFDEWTAEISLDPADLDAASITAEVHTASGSTGNGQFDDSMLANDGLAPEDFPLARFVSTDIRTTETGYEAHGVMTIRGADQPFVLPFTLDINNDHAIASARVDLARLDYGVGGSSWGDVAATVTLVLHIEADSAD